MLSICRFRCPIKAILLSYFLHHFLAISSQKCYLCLFQLIPKGFGPAFPPKLLSSLPTTSRFNHRFSGLSRPSLLAARGWVSPLGTAFTWLQDTHLLASYSSILGCLFFSLICYSGSIPKLGPGLGTFLFLGWLIQFHGLTISYTLTAA